ncbi:hypothetical protein BD410DRAFT_804463 [Rickenella mellea]|uniref:Uncharacterized protein n=1 Tax=Rickenella mellea TaxID=50990 RepID=A0A4Y7Q117_9AGAM|nr:hypothetical protein BD410DRAFT_804463 [Rickenella mellea]
MTIHFQDKCPISAGSQHNRLTAARAVTEKHIPCIIWAEDALCFAHNVPTALLDQQLLVPDAFISQAANAISERLSYMIPSQSHIFEERRGVRTDRMTPDAFPSSVRLKHAGDESNEDLPKHILIHPQSYFHIDNESTRYQAPLLPSNASLRFTTVTSFLDSLVDTLLDPTIGYSHWRLNRTLMVYISYLSLYSLRLERTLGEGEPTPPLASDALSSMKEENRLLVDQVWRGTDIRKPWLMHVRERRELMLNTPRYAAALRPLPVDPIRGGGLGLLKRQFGTIVMHKKSPNVIKPADLLKRTLKAFRFFGK